MSRTARVLVLVLGLASLPATAARKTTLNGDYRWGGGSRQPLEATFTATGEDVWKVAFYFEHGGRPHTYRGTARGSLTGGVLAGTVKTENKRRTFSFECTFDNGSCRGTHYEVHGRRRSKTGTLTLKAKSRPQAVRLRPTQCRGGDTPGSNPAASRSAAEV